MAEARVARDDERWAAASVDGWPEVRRLLVVRLDNVGDVVMLTPALRALRARFPAAHLTLLASPAGATVGPLLPWVDEVVVLRALWQQLDGSLGRTPAEELAVVESLAAGDHDAAYIFTSFSQSPHPPAYACTLAGIPVRVGESKEFGGAVLTHWVRGSSDDDHQVDRNLRLLAATDVPLRGTHLELAVPPEVTDSAGGLLAGVGVGVGERFVVLAPGASAPARRWPAERFGAVARRVADVFGLASVVVGSPRDEERAAEVVAASGGVARSLAGATSVSELAEVVRRSAAVVTNNSGPMHLADAFRRPVVVPFAGTDLEAQWAPRAAAARLLRRPTPCSPCYRITCPYDLECLDVDPDEVVAALAGGMLDPAVG